MTSSNDGAHTPLTPLMDAQAYAVLRARVMGDPATHAWVKRVVDDIERHDPVDVLNALDVLMALAEARATLAELEAELEAEIG